MLRTHWLRTGSLLLLGITLSGLSSGCAKFPVAVKNPFSWVGKEDLEDKHGKPSRMAVIWTDDVFHQTGTTPTRGFGGRIYFYNDSHKAIPVDGQLVVYGYDDSKHGKSESPNRTPDRKFVFPADQFKVHYSKSELGPSYSIWIPWDAAGGPSCEVSLVPMFTSVSGQIVTGQQSTNVLPGPKVAPPTGEAQAVNRLQFHEQTELPGLQQAAFAANLPAGQSSAGALSRNAGAEREAAERLRTMTIPLPQSMTQRMARSVPMTAAQAMGRTAGNTGATELSADGAPTQTPIAAAPSPLPGGQGWGNIPSRDSQSAGQSAGQGAAQEVLPLTHSVPRQSLAPRGPIQRLAPVGVR